MADIQDYRGGRGGGPHENRWFRDNGDGTFGEEMSTANRVWDTNALAWVKETQPSAGGGGGAVTIADGADVAQGTTTDLSSSNTVIGILKAIKAAITGTVAVSGTFWQATQPVSGTVTANVGTTNGIALDATLTGGTALSRITNGTQTADTVAGDSGQNALLSAGPRKETSFSTTAASGSVASTDVSNYAWVSVQVNHNGNGATITVQFSNDNVTWVSGTLMVSTALGTSGSNTLTVGLYHGPVMGRYFRLSFTGNTGTVDGVAEFFAQPRSYSGGNAVQSGTWTVQPGNTANTTAWKVDGSAVTQPVSAASLPLPSGAATSALQTTISGQLPATLGSKVSASSLGVVVASDQAAIPTYKVTGGQTTVMKTGTLTTTAVTADQVVLTYTVTAAKTFYLCYLTMYGRLTATSATATILGSISLETPSGTKVITLDDVNPTTSEVEFNPITFGEPIPVAAGVVIRVVVTPAATTSMLWRANFGGYEK